MKTVTLTIDGQKISARPGEKLLRAALDNGIYIPNLCYIKDKPESSASCRLCWVEIEGIKEPVTSCTVVAAEGMAVNTRGEKSLALARAGFELIMASHALDCAHCAANGVCELQKIARHLKVSLKTKRLRLLTRELPLDDSNPLFTYDPNKCVLCGRCIWACRHDVQSGVFGFAHRGFDRVMTTFADEPIGKDQCLDCHRCIEVCPTGALAFKDSVKTPDKKG